MTRTELEARLQKECNLPFYKAKVVERDYSEWEFQEMKVHLIKDYQDYVDNYLDYAYNDF
jgi:hypothetical protein